MSFDYIINYTIFGDNNVGKKTLISNIIKGNKQSNNSNPNNDYITNDIYLKGQQYTLVIYNSNNISINDIEKGTKTDSKSENIFNIIKKSACNIIIYDKSNRESFSNIEKWVQFCQKYTTKTAINVLIGNKSDLKNEKINYKEGEELAKKVGMLFLETSAKNGDNVNKVFEMSINKIIENIQKGIYNLSDYESCGIHMVKKIKNITDRIEDDKVDKCLYYIFLPIILSLIIYFASFIYKNNFSSFSIKRK